MSVDKWNWSPIRDTRPGPGDCDLCDYEEDETYTVAEPTASAKGE